MLREVARVLSVSANKRVVIVDTSNEIAGDGDIPHNAIGNYGLLTCNYAAEVLSVLVLFFE